MEVAVVEVMMIAVARDRHIHLREEKLLLHGLASHPCLILHSELRGVQVHNHGAAAKAAHLTDSNRLTAIPAPLQVTGAQQAMVPAEVPEGLLVTAQDPPDHQDMLLLPDPQDLPVTVLVDLLDPLATDRVCLVDRRAMHPLGDHLLDLTAMELMVLLIHGINNSKQVINSIHTTHRTTQRTVEKNDQEVSSCFFFSFLFCIVVFF